MTRHFHTGTAFAAAVLACFGARPAACVAASVAAPASRQGDASSAWTALGRPSEGLHLRDGWVISCFRQPIDPASKGFESVEIAACKQEAILQLVMRCTGDGEVADTLHPALRGTVESAYTSWYGGKVMTSGATWVATERRSDHDLAVLALPESVCASMPRRADWRLHAREVAAGSESWIPIAAIAQAADAKDVTALRTMIADRLRKSTAARGASWPSAFIKLPDALPQSQLKGLGLGDLARLAVMRPGDGALWTALAERCTEAGLALGAEEVRGAPSLLGWPAPAAAVEPDRWSAVEVGDLPPPLVAVVRHAGAIPAQAAPKGEVERRAGEAFFAKEPRLAEAESLAREACTKPSPDALNLLAAIRLADPSASRHALMQALAFSTQASALDANHPFARVNAARAMQRLGWKEQVRSALAAMPPASGAWQQREIERLSAWVRETDSMRPPESKTP